MDRLEIITRRMGGNASQAAKAKGVMLELEGLTYRDAYEVLDIVCKTLEYHQEDQSVGGLGGGV